MTCAPCVRAQSMPAATSSDVPLPSSSSTRTGSSFAPGATEETPTPLPVGGDRDPAHVRAVAVAVLRRRVVLDEVAARAASARRGRGGRAATPESTTAITAPAPVAVACAASDSTRSRFHCSPRRGSFAARAAAGARRARQEGEDDRRRIRTHAVARVQRARQSADRVYVITYRRMATAADPLVVSVGPRVRALREAMDLSLRDLAERTGVSAPMLSQVERGETSPTLQVAARIAAGLELRL